MKHFRYKGGCASGVTSINVFRRAGYGYILRVISNNYNVVYYSHTSKKLKKTVVLSFQNVVYIAMWSLVMYSNCLEWSFLKEQKVINLLLCCC